MLQVNNDNFQQCVIESKKPVLVDFFADWCSPCKVMLPDLEELDSEQDDLIICKVDVDANDHLCSTFKISNLPTIILFCEGKEVARTVGMMNKKDLQEMALQLAN